MRLTRRWSVLLAVLGVVLLVAAGGVYYVTARGFSARDQPTFVEATLARQLRHLGVPDRD